MRNHDLITEDDLDVIFQFFSQGIVAFDLETTGLSPFTDSIIEIGAVKITPEKGVETFQQLINPEILIPPNTIAIHNITDDMVKGSPTIDKVLPKFMDFIGNLPLLAHNAKFDIGFLIFALRRLGDYPPVSEVYDSCKLIRSLFKNAQSYKLSRLADFFKVDIKNHHRALVDAWVCLQIFIKGLDHLSQKCQDQDVKKNGLLFYLNKFNDDKNYKLPDHLTPIIPKLTLQETIEIKYRGGSYPDRFRPIKPIGIIPLPHGLVLHGLCMLSMKTKSFLIHKIAEVRFLNEQEQKKWNELNKKHQEQLESASCREEEDE